MSSVISVVQDYGTDYPGYSEVAKNAFYFVPVDDGTASKSSNPVVIPDAGTNYSYEVWIRARCDAAPAVRCENFKIWYNSGLSGGFDITVNTDIISTYVQPVEIQSSVGNRVSFSTKASAGNSISLDGTLTDIGDYSSWLVFQLEIPSTATAGDYTALWTLQYDEI